MISCSCSSNRSTDLHIQSTSPAPDLCLHALFLTHALTLSPQLRLQPLAGQLLQEAQDGAAGVSEAASICLGCRHMMITSQSAPRMTAPTAQYQQSPTQESLELHLVFSRHQWRGGSPVDAVQDTNSAARANRGYSMS